jgi:nucleotide-binding universal stress UspA family protein
MKIKPSGKGGRVTVELGYKDDLLLEKNRLESDKTFRPPFQLRKILVPTDFSECSIKALDYALAFAERSQAEIILLHVVEPMFFPASAQDMPSTWSLVQEDVLKVSRNHLVELGQERAGDREVREPMKTVVRLGNPYWEIVEAAKSLEADLIILATHGHTGIKHILMGSTAERVVRLAPCPVLTVREREREFAG